MPRYRLRFLVQEVDLHPGETVIGRSATCHLTIEDPLVSRQHAKIIVTKDGAAICDLKSRNGLLVNGKLTRGQQRLRDGDRVRIGTIEMVFCVADEPAGEEKYGRRITGFMCHCASCGFPYPAEAQQCPQCGSTRRAEDDTLTDTTTEEATQQWSVALAVEVLRRAAEKERWHDALRMLEHSRHSVESRLARGEAVASEHISVMADVAARVALALGQPSWAQWSLGLLTATQQLPANSHLDALEALPARTQQELQPAFRKVLMLIDEQQGPETLASGVHRNDQSGAEQQEAINRLRRLTHNSPVVLEA